MLIISREPGNSVHVGSADETCVVTLLKLDPNRSAVSVLVNRTSAARPGQLDSRTLELPLDTPTDIARDVQITLVHLLDTKARIGVNAPKHCTVHRLEVYEAIRREDQGPPGPDAGPAASPVPRPPSPKPPHLNERLKEPPPDDDAA